MYYDPHMLQKARHAQLFNQVVDLAVYCTYLMDVPFAGLRYEPVVANGGEVVALVITLMPYGTEDEFKTYVPVPFDNVALWTRLGMLYGRYQERLLCRNEVATYGDTTQGLPELAHALASDPA